MNRKERLMKTLRGEKVDRPPFCFYEINGLDEDTENMDEFNVFNDPSWKRIVDLAKNKTDRIVMRKVGFKNVKPSYVSDRTTVKQYTDSKGRLWTNTEIRVSDRIFISKNMRDPNVLTTWRIEHLLKDSDDLVSWLDLPEEEFSGEVDIANILDAEELLGDTGIVSIDWADPLCKVAELFSMEDFTIVALTEQELFHKALEREFELQYKKVEAIAQALPGRLWRIVGPEYACPPYLPPYLFNDYVVKYDRPLIELIKKYGGYPRIHCHGRIKEVLPYIHETGCIGIDPIEPNPQGNVELINVRKEYGKDFVLFGNLEFSDIENIATEDLEKKVIQAIKEGTYGEGRGFVLMPSASPISRNINDLTIKNYEKIVEIMDNYENIF